MSDKTRATAADRRLFQYASAYGRQRFNKDCAFCLAQFEVYGPDCMMPPHEAAEDCERDRQPHCTCSRCW